MVTPSYYHGIAIVDDNDNGYVFSPIYPFVTSGADIAGLLEFVDTFREELLDFYKNGGRSYFTDYLFQFDTELKDRFKSRWHQKGVLID